MKTKASYTNPHGRLAAFAAAFLALSSVTFPPRAHAQLISAVDQEQTVDNCSNNSGGDGLASRKGQTFVPTFAGLDAVELKLAGSGLSDGVQAAFLVNIRETNLHGRIVGTSSITTLPDDFFTSVVGFSFSSIVPLTPGSTYAIELVPLVLGQFDFTVRVSCTDLYSGGTYFTGPDWPLASSDAWFRTGLQLRPSIRVSEVELCWATVSNKTYQVQYRSELTTNVWSNLGAPIPGDGATNCTKEQVLPTQPRRFYRVTLAP